MREQFDRLRCLCDFLEKAISKEAKRRRANAQRQYNKAKSEEERGFISVGIDDRLFEIGRDFAKFAAAVYVLHAFQKRTQKTRREDNQLARKRYHQIGDRS